MLIDATLRVLTGARGMSAADIAGTLDPARNMGEHDLLRAYRTLAPRPQGALLEVAWTMAASHAPRTPA